MLFKCTVAAMGATLILAGSAIATDSFAKGQKGKKTFATKPGKKSKTGKAPSAQTGSTTWSNPGTPPTNVNRPSDFSLSGPYIGLKYKKDVD